MKNFPRIVLAISICYSIACKPTAKIQVLQPADLIIPEHIQKIVLIDRSKPAGGFWTNVESVLTGEEYQQDKEGRRRAIDALSAALTRTPRFQTIYSGVELEGTRSGRAYAPPLSWAEVERLCKQYQGDALVAIEMFDSDIQSSTTTRSIKEKNKDGVEITKIVYDGKRNGRVNLGWRFYDPKNRVMLDEFKDSDYEDVTSSGASTANQATLNLKKTYEIVRSIAEKLGAKYGKRIAPTWITLARTYHKSIKGNNKDRFEQAARYADAGEWPRAASIWEKIAGINSDADAAGKATYNLAVAAEVNGQLNMALQFAKDAYTQFNDKKAKYYIQILEKRIEDQETLRRQMHDSKKT